jgi:hypothetical protein
MVDCLLFSLLAHKSVPGQDTHDHLTAPIVVHDGKAESHTVGINECGLDNTSVFDDGDRDCNRNISC